MTTIIDLPVKEYTEIADAAEDFYCTNGSSHTMMLLHQATQPAATEKGHPVTPGARIHRDPATPDKIWLFSEVGGRVFKN